MCFAHFYPFSREHSNEAYLCLVYIPPARKVINLVQELDVYDAFLVHAIMHHPWKILATLYKSVNMQEPRMNHNC